MARPSTNLDIKLLQTGKKIIANEGSRGLTIPKICKCANVNLGMFNYHFKTIDNYIKVLYADIKNNIDSYIGIEKIKNQNSLQKLRFLMLKLSEFTEQNHKLARFIFIDCLMCNKCNKRFIDNEIVPNFIILNLVRKAQEEGLLQKDIPAIEIYSSLILGFLGPEIFKNEFIERENAFYNNGPKFVDFPVEKRLHNILKDYIM